MSLERENINDTYPLTPPFSYALIQTDPKSGQLQYQVIESPLTHKEDEIYKMVIDVITETLEFDFRHVENRESASNFLRSKVLDIIRNYNISIEESSFDKIVYVINKNFIGFGIIDPLLADPNIEDISCDGTNVPVYIVHRQYQSIPTTIKFDSDDDLNSFVIKVAQRSGRHISVADPLLDAALPDGSRINCTYGREITKRGPTFTIRKFKADPLTIVDLISFNTIDEKLAAFLWFVLEHQKSLLIAGGTASGKTTLLNGVAMFIKPGNKIVSIEDTPELNLPHENWIQSVTRSGFGGFDASGKKRGEITMYDLLKAGMRQRPDFLFIGEVRGAEAFTLFQAMSTGHAGMGTIHGDSPMGVVRRLETEPMNIPRSMIASLDLIAVQRNIRRGMAQSIRRTVEVVEIVGVDANTKDLITNRVFVWDPRDDIFQYSGRSYILEAIQDMTGYGEDQIQEELEFRATILKALVQTKKRTYQDVTRAITDYYADPRAAFSKYQKMLKSAFV